MSPLLLVLALSAGPTDRLQVGLLADPVTLFPHRATDLVSQAILVNTSDTLVRPRVGSDRPEGVLVTTWATPDSRTWTFTLRERVRFHDGVPLDADAVVRNFESLRRHRGFAGTAERLGPLVVRVNLDRPNAALLDTLSQPYFAMQSPRALHDGAPPVGTGPFRLLSSKPGLVELHAEPSAWAGAPRLQRLVFRRYPGEEALVAALLAGEVDLTSALSPARMEALRSRPGLALDSFTGQNVAFLSVNNERSPWHDARLRHALSRAIDRRALLSRFLGGHGEAARGPLPPSLLALGGTSRELLLDRASAVRLLGEAGFPQGLEAEMLVTDAPRPYLPTPSDMAKALKEQFAAVGIRLSLRPTASWTDYLERASRGDYELALLGWQADSADPADFLAALLSSEAAGATNRSRYRSPDLDAVLKRARRESGPRDREAAFREVESLFQRDMPFVPLFHVPVFTAYRVVLRGVVPGPTGLLRYDKTWKLE